jgi:hypothetical protein
MDDEVDALSVTIVSGLLRLVLAGVEECELELSVSVEGINVAVASMAMVEVMEGSVKSGLSNADGAGDSEVRGEFGFEIK